MDELIGPRDSAFVARVRQARHLLRVLSQFNKHCQTILSNPYQLPRPQTCTLFVLYLLTLLLYLTYFDTFTKPPVWEKRRETMAERAPLLSDCKICVACSNALGEDTVMQVRVNLQKISFLLQGFKDLDSRDKSI